MKTKRLLPVALMLLGVCVIMMSCKKEKTPETPTAKKAIPNASSNVSLPLGTVGDLILKNEGNDGFTSDGTSIRGTEWTYYNGETGGVNNTYALQRLNDAGILAIVIRWAYNNFHEFELHPGWQGALESGLHMGDSVYKFQAAYGSNFHLQGAYIDRYELIQATGKPLVIMDFSSTTGILIKVVVTAQ